MPLLGIDPKDSKSSNRNEVGWAKLDEKKAGIQHAQDFQDPDPNLYGILSHELRLREAR